MGTRACLNVAPSWCPQTSTTPHSLHRRGVSRWPHLVDLEWNTGCSSILVSQLNTVACERLIRRTFSPHELPSLIEDILSGKTEDEILRRLPVDDAQVFVYVIDEVRTIFTYIVDYLTKVNVCVLYFLDVGYG